MSTSQKKSNYLKAIKVFVWIIFALTIVSTFFLAISPLLPTSEEYKGSFPENISENISTLPNTIFRHLVLFNEYFNFFWLLNFLSSIFFLLLLFNIKTAIDDYESEKLIANYFNWAVSSLLITIVFITKAINPENMTDISLGVLGLTVSILILLFVNKVLKPFEEPKKQKEENLAKEL